MSPFCTYWTCVPILGLLSNKISFGKRNTTCFNPLLPSVHKSARIAKILILKLKGIIKKIFYDRRNYELVYEKSLS